MEGNINYIGAVSVVQVQTGTVTIKDGVFELAEQTAAWSSTYLLNCIDANYTAGTAKFAVQGGTYKDGFNPADANGEPQNPTSYLDTGYKAFENADGSYEVKETKTLSLSAPTDGTGKFATVQVDSVSMDLTKEPSTQVVSANDKM